VNRPLHPFRQEVSDRSLGGPAAEAGRSAGGVVAWAIRALVDQGMPWSEIGSILGSDDAELVRRYLELHRERLEERLAEQCAALDSIEPLLLERSLGRTLCGSEGPTEPAEEATIVRGPTTVDAW